MAFSSLLILLFMYDKKPAHNLSTMTLILTTFKNGVMAHSIPSVPTPYSPPPPPGHLSGICHLVCLGGGDLSENLFPGVGYWSIPLLDAVNVFPFSTFH